MTEKFLKMINLMNCRCFQFNSENDKKNQLNVHQIINYEINYSN